MNMPPADYPGPTPPPDMVQDAIDMTYPPEPGDVVPEATPEAAPEATTTVETPESTTTVVVTPEAAPEAD